MGNTASTDLHTYKCENCSRLYRGKAPADGHTFCRTCRSLIKKGLLEVCHDTPQEQRNWEKSFGLPKSLRGWTLEEVMKAANIMGYGPDYGRFAADCYGGRT